MKRKEKKIEEKQRKGGETAPFVVNSTKSQALYQAALGLCTMYCLGLCLELFGTACWLTSMHVYQR